MKKLLFLGILGCFLLTAAAQKVEVRNPDIIPITYLGQTGPLRDYVEDPDAVNEVTRGPRIGVHPKDWPLNAKVDPRALPLGTDPAWQRVYAKALPQRAPVLSYNGIGFTSVNPPDPVLDVGPNHIIQMTNDASGSLFQIWDKNGASLVGPLLFDNFVNLPGGAGDPIVLYDQIADRWLMSEFAASGNFLLIALSTSPDPLGTWHTYVFQTPFFPDYPKYAVWPDAYYVTTNEDDPAVYALDRVKMLVGDTGVTAQRFTIPSVPTLSFQTSAPVDFEGTALPPVNTPGYIMRMVDDGWSMSIDDDYLEIWEFDVDFDTPGNSSLTGPDTLHTMPFDSELCGYTSFSCIEQPRPPGNPPDLDPLREVLMNRVHYRNFGTHEAIVCNHVTDVNGNDRAGIRWYELRKSTDWEIYQQGTYSPDTDSRWMAAIAMDHEGNIALAYNVSSDQTYPSLRYTGRSQCDPPGVMTLSESVIATGTAVNNSNRYGDYSCMSVDPVTGRFWFTGEYNPASQWSTRIASFDPETCVPSVSFVTQSTSAAEAEADADSACLAYKDYHVKLKIAIPPSQAAGVSFTVVNETGTSGLNGDYVVFPSMLTLSGANPVDSFTVRVFDDTYVEGDDTLTLGLVVDANGGNAVPGIGNTHRVMIKDNDVAPDEGLISDVINADFESGAQGFTTVNPSGDDDWAIDNAAGASSANWDVPNAGTGQIFYINDDGCGMTCDMEDVKLITPALDLSGSTQTFITFDSYFLGNTYEGDMESASLEISIDNAPFAPIPGAQLAGATVWQTLEYDLSAYDGESNIRIAFKYSDGTGWLYGWAVDNVVVSGKLPVDIQTDVNTPMPAEAYLGPFETGHFYDPVSGKIIVTIANTSDADFGCTTVEVDRQGTVPDALPFTSDSPSTFLHSKTLKVTPEHDVSGSYTITMYYESAEVVAWNAITGNSAGDASIIKVAGDNSIGDVTPENFESFTINVGTMTAEAYGADTLFTASFTGGYSGFGVGRYCNLIVTNTSDTAEGSLRAALACAKDGDTIRFDDNLFSDTIVLSSDPLLFDRDVVLFSSPGENLTIDASDLGRAFEIAASADAEIIGITVLSGSDPAGRGILNHGTLVLRDVTIFNHLTAGDGEVLTNDGVLSLEGVNFIDD